MPISVASPRPEGRGLAALLRRLVRRTLAGEGLRPGAVGLLLAGDAELRELNRRYRGLDRATDVLSFGYDAPRSGRPARGRRVSGDLAVSLDRVAEQARRFRCSRGRELARLVVHGALHLAGLDHRSAAERRHMRAREEAGLRGARAAVRALEARLDPPRRGAARRAASRPRGRR